MDESEKGLDKKFVSRMEFYFTRTGPGRNRGYRIVPVPLFVSSDMTYAVQAADVCLYALNWGFRPASWHGLESREDIAVEFGPKLHRLQWQGDVTRAGQVYRSWGIVYVQDPYTALARNEEGGNAPDDPCIQVSTGPSLRLSI